jgi:hypothetical protein
MIFGSVVWLWKPENPIAKRMSVWPSSPCPAAATAAGKPTALKIPSRLIF